MSNFSCAEANVNVFEVKKDGQFYQPGLCQMVGKYAQTKYKLGTIYLIKRRRNPGVTAAKVDQQRGGKPLRVPLTPSKMGYAKSGQPRSQALSIKLTSGLVNIIG
jgi:hypothetical protein